MPDGNYCCKSIHDTKEKTSDATGDALYGTVICIRAGINRELITNSQPRNTITKRTRNTINNKFTHLLFCFGDLSNRYTGQNEAAMI